MAKDTQPIKPHITGIEKFVQDGQPLEETLKALILRDIKIAS